MNKEERVFRIVSNDGSYIDYTRHDSGVRVWKDKCQAIGREDANSEWSGIEAPRTIPILPDQFQPQNVENAPLYLSLALEKLENDPKGREAKELVYGHLAFEKVISTQ